MPHFSASLCRMCWEWSLLQLFKGAITCSWSLLWKKKPWWGDAALNHPLLIQPPTTTFTIITAYSMATCWRNKQNVLKCGFPPPPLIVSHHLPSWPFWTELIHQVFGLILLEHTPKEPMIRTASIATVCYSPQQWVSEITDSMTKLNRIFSKAT